MLSSTMLIDCGDCFGALNVGCDFLLVSYHLGSTRMFDYSLLT